MNLMTTIQALGDNYIYLYQYDQGNTFVVDPGDSAPVLDVLESRGLSLSAILATHNHYDHVGGARELKAKTDCQIIGPSRNGIPGIDRIVEDSEVLEFSGTSVRVVATPGHTGSGESSLPVTHCSSAAAAGFSSAMQRRCGIRSKESPPCQTVRSSIRATITRRRITSLH